MKPREVMTNLPADESPHLTVQQLAKRWHTTPNAIYVRRHKGKAPRGFKSGREVLFPLTQVEAWEQAALDADPQSNRDTKPEMRPAEPSRPRGAKKYTPAA